MAPRGNKRRSSAKSRAALSDEEVSDYESAPPVKSSRNSASSEADEAAGRPKRNGRVSKKVEREVDEDDDIEIEDADVNEDEDEDEEGDDLEEDVYETTGCCAAYGIET